MQTFVHDYADKMMQIHQKLLEFIEQKGKQENGLKNLISLIDKLKIRENKHELKAFLLLISKISNNHYRTNDFFDKINQIITILQKDIKNSFSNIDIFNIFERNKRVLLILLEEKILVPSKSLATLVTSYKYKKSGYAAYFFLEFESFYDEKFKQQILTKNPEMSDITLFIQKRKSGENDSHICEVIRSDSVEKFFNFAKNTELSLVSKIEPSIYETNPFLLNKKPSLIEYAAFFGSIQIFNFLKENNVKLNSSLWSFAVHSNNLKMIEILHECKVECDYLRCCFESIRCHHLEITEHIMKNFLSKESNDLIFRKSFQYYNFIVFCKLFESFDKLGKMIFYDSCRNDSFLIVDYILKNEEIDINHCLSQI